MGASAGTPTRTRRGCWSPATPAAPTATANRAWKAGLAALAAETGLDITCCHFPPGTSKWNQIEHRLFCQITLAWRGRPLTSYDVIINTWTPTGFVDTIRSGTMVYEERTGSGTGSQEVHPGI